MGKKKLGSTQGTCESSSRLTRSKAGCFDILAECEDEFPALQTVVSHSADALKSNGKADLINRIGVGNIEVTAALTSGNKGPECVGNKEAVSNSTAGNQTLQTQ